MQKQETTPEHGLRIEIKQLSKTYGDFSAVKSATFTVEPGSMTGFLGANGAGKTTTMRMIMGLLEPTSGEVLVNGSPITAEHRASFGYMPEERGLYPKQPILNQLVYLGQLRGMPATDAKQQASAYLTELGLGDRLKDKLESLSLGNQQRVQIVASILHRPKALILDEPFSGLDPKAVDTMVAMLNELMGQGVPVLFSSHQLDLVDRLCDRVVILHKGEIRAAGSAEELRQSGPLRYKLICGEDSGWVRQLPFVADDSVSVIDVHGREAILEIIDKEQIDSTRQVILAEAMNHSLQEFSRILPTLGDIYRGVSQQ